MGRGCDSGVAKVRGDRIGSLGVARVRLGGLEMAA